MYSIVNKCCSLSKRKELGFQIIPYGWRVTQQLPASRRITNRNLRYEFYGESKQTHNTGNIYSRLLVNYYISYPSHLQFCFNWHSWLFSMSSSLLVVFVMMSLCTLQECLVLFDTSCKICSIVTNRICLHYCGFLFLCSVNVIYFQWKSLFL